MAADEDQELLDAPTVGAAVRVIGARDIQERFGIPAEAARALAEAVIPAGDLGVQVIAGSTGILLRPVRVPGIAAADPPLAELDQVAEETTLEGLLDLAALWVDEAPGRSLRVVVTGDAVAVALLEPDGTSVEIARQRVHPEMPSVLAHAALTAAVREIDGV